MERKVGEVFEFEGKRYEVVEAPDTGYCYGCAFINKPVSYCMNVSKCLDREDRESVIFVEVKE